MCFEFGSYPDGSFNFVGHPEAKAGYLPDRKEACVCKPRLGPHSATRSSAYFPSHQTIDTPDVCDPSLRQPFRTARGHRDLCVG